MKLVKLLQSFVIICAFSNLLLGQTAPSLENGFKPYGSYEGSQLDSVNLMNGNLMMHVPLIPGVPQRGSLQVSTSLYVTSKDWQVSSCSSGTGVCKWVKGGTGINIVIAPSLRVHRTVNNNYVYANTIISTAFAYTIVGPDESTHSLHGVAGTEDSTGEPTQFDSVDLSGYHLTMSVPDSAQPTVLLHFTVTDRDGNKYEGDFGTDFATSATCPHPATFLISSPGHVQPVVDDSPSGDQYCSQTAHASSVTDRNGNQMALGGGIGGTFVTADTLGRPSLNGAPTTDFTNCVSPYPISQAQLYTYHDPSGIAHNITVCYSEFPIQTAFNVTNVAEAVSNSSTTAHFIPVASVMLADGSYWAFNYDNYGEVTSIHLPTGGSLSYVWQTIAFPTCTGGARAPVSRSISTRTLNDNQGHSSQWSYNWSAVSSTNLVNIVTDPAGNDATHNFTDLATQIGAGGACKFYETSIIRYKGAASANIPLERTDTSYNVAGIAVDDPSPGIGNIFATDVVTTVYPSGKVKKLHKDPDPGLGAGLPSFGNVIKELDYDWGQGAPGPLLRETDTVYQWQKADTSGNKPYLAAHFLDLPASTVVITPTTAANIKSNCPLTVTTTANCMAETDYSYDEPAYFTASSPAVTTQHVAAPWSVRGNQTTVSHWLSTGSTWTSSHTNWYDTGEAYQQIDPLGHTTTHSYDAAYVGAYSTQTCSPSTGGVAHCLSGTYDFNTGLLTSLTNENATAQANGNTAGDSGHTSNYSYDSMLRLASAQAPPDPANGSVRAQTSFNFSAANAFPFSVQRTKSITASLTDSATSYYDGLGRVYQSQHVLPNGTSTVDTTFDDIHSQVIVTNPYFSTTDPTYGSTTTLSDPLGRALQITEQDGSIKKVDYDVVALSGAVGNCTLTTDEAGNKRRNCTDGLGRLVEVDEPNAGAAATYAQATVSISGSEQSNPLPAAYGSGYVDIGGSEGNFQSCTDPLPPRLPVCNTAYDTGTIYIQVGSYPAKSVNFGNSSTTTATVASALAAAFHNDTAAPADGSISPTNSSRVVLTARSAGSVGNYALSASPLQATAPDFYGTPSGASLTGGRDASSSPDTGTVTIMVGSAAYQTTYGGSDTASSIATRLAAAISGGPWANASASGGTVTITAKSTTGPGGDYTLSASSSYDTAHFGQPSFTAAPSANALSGGYDAGVIDNQPFRTLYQYDALGNLLRVDQKGTAPNDSTQWRTRTFTYDSLSRLLTASNPESGTIMYSYDLDGNLLQKTSPAPNQTGTATQTVSFCYDALHRVTGKGYGAQSCPLATPVVTYAYDSGTNAIGKLTSLTDQAGTATYSYDVLGRLAAETRPIAGVSKSTGYTYNLDGSVKTLTYPSGRVVTYTPGAGGVLTSAVDGNGTQYVSSATYYASGAEYQRFMPGIYFRTDFNPRLQVSGFYSDNGQVTSFFINKAYDYGPLHQNNGNVISITNNKDSNRTQTFTYDGLNRIASGWSSANTGAYSWGENYSIDAWGNLQISPMGGKAHGGTFQLSGNAQNRPTGMAYDAAGNLMSYLSATYTYDQENRLSSTSGMSYTYDGNGERVLKSNSSTGAAVKRYWSVGGNTLAEGDGSGNLTAEYIYFGSKRIARIDLPANTVHYYLSDHLGSTSVVVSAAGTVEEESDYYPFGTEVVVTGPGTNELKFTGKRRDTESQMDYFGARYFGNPFGRFMTPDPLIVQKQKLIDPQQWDMYQYARNNPLRFTDPTGKYVCQGNKTQCGIVHAALDNMKIAASNLKEGSKERNILEKSIKAYGKEGVKNGVAVKFDNLKGSAESQTVTHTDKTATVTFDLNKMAEDYAAAPSRAAEVTGTVAHEGAIVSNERVNGPPEDRAAIHRDEMAGSTADAAVHMGLGIRSFYGLWDPAWDPTQAGALRDAGIKREADFATDYDCKINSMCK